MFACKDIFAKPSITQAHGVCIGRSPKTCVARLSAYIIAYFITNEKGGFFEKQGVNFIKQPKRTGLGVFSKYVSKKDGQTE